MKTFIINLKRSQMRRKYILREAQKHGLDFQLIEGVDGLSLSEKEINEFCDENALKEHSVWLTREAIGCQLSHYSIYKKVLEDNLDMAFIIEDDIILPDNILDLLKNISKHIKKNEIISLFNLSYDTRKLSTSGAIQLTKKYQLMYPINFEKFTSAVAYVITKEACKSLTSVILPINTVADDWITFYERGGFQSYRCIHPMPIKLTLFKSTRHASRQSFFRSKFTQLVDDYRIPPFYQAFRYARQKETDRMLGTVISKESSIYQINTEKIMNL